MLSGTFEDIEPDYLLLSGMGSGCLCVYVDSCFSYFIGFCSELMLGCLTVSSMLKFLVKCPTGSFSSTGVDLWCVIILRSWFYDEFYFAIFCELYFCYRLPEVLPSDKLSLAGFCMTGYGAFFGFYSCFLFYVYLSYFYTG